MPSEHTAYLAKVGAFLAEDSSNNVLYFSKPRVQWYLLFDIGPNGRVPLERSHALALGDQFAEPICSSLILRINRSSGRLTSIYEETTGLQNLILCLYP